MKKVLLLNVASISDQTNLGIKAVCDFRQLNSGIYERIDTFEIEVFFNENATARQIEKAIIDAIIAYAIADPLNELDSLIWDDLTSKDIISFVSVSIG